MVKKLCIGTRKSELALVQTRWVEQELKRLDPQLQIEIVPMTTTGDKILNVALSKIGEKSLFTKELERALETRQVDMVVHSLKDLPTVLPDGLLIGAVCEREDHRDAVIMKQEHQGKHLKCLSADSIVGTSSLRRTAQLQRRFPYLQFRSVRGNLNTRLRKLDTGDGEADFSAVVLAVAGVVRLGWADRISTILSADECLSAVGQGALAVECRADDTDVLQLVSGLSHGASLLSCVAERALLARLEGGCSAPVAAHCRLTDGTLQLTAGVWSLDGGRELKRQLSAPLPQPADGDNGEPGAKRRHHQPRHFVAVWAPQREHDQLAAAEQLGVDTADLLLAAGARQILAEAKAANDGAASSNGTMELVAAAKAASAAEQEVVVDGVDPAGGAAQLASAGGDVAGGAAQLASAGGDLIGGAAQLASAGGDAAAGAAQLASAGGDVVGGAALSAAAVTSAAPT